MTTKLHDAPLAPTTTPDLGPARALTCRECGAKVDLGPFYACQECFGPLEVAYEFGRVTRESIEAGPRNIWRYQDLLPVPSTVRDTPNLEPGATPQTGCADCYVYEITYDGETTGFDESAFPPGGAELVEVLSKLASDNVPAQAAGG